jgi:hypothetical protein
LVLSGCGLILRYYPGIHAERLRKITKTSIMIASHWGRDSNPGPTEYKAGVLTTRPRCSVSLLAISTSSNLRRMHLRHTDSGWLALIGFKSTLLSLSESHLVLCGSKGCVWKSCVSGANRSSDHPDKFIMTFPHKSLPVIYPYHSVNQSQLMDKRIISLPNSLCRSKSSYRRKVIMLKNIWLKNYNLWVVISCFGVHVFIITWLQIMIAVWRVTFCCYA